MTLKGKKIIVGISGGIAAYKIPLLVRLLKKAGAEVRVMMTSSAASFVSPLVLSTLSENNVGLHLENDSNWENHVEWALWADVMVFAPCTANILAKMAHGICDSFLLAVYFSAKCEVLFAPAMDLDMYQHPTTNINIDKLKSFGNIEIEAETGFLASGLHGKGRMAEIENIFSAIENYFVPNTIWLNKKVVITAGPTYEAIDPVRFIGNHSSGQMGFELAELAANFGAQVTLITGPSALNISHKNIKRIDVHSAVEMLHVSEQYFETCDVFIGAAAVADYRPKVIATEKIKKQDEKITIELEKNPDILATLGQRKNNQILIGFALETNNEEAFALAKVNKKNLDFIVLNSLNDKGAGFKSDTNKITILRKNGDKKSFELKSKKEVAHDILAEIAPLL